jgi:hypothetical protein
MPSDYDLVFEAVTAATSKADLKKKLDELAKANPNFFIDGKQVVDGTKIPFTVASRLAFEAAHRPDEIVHEKVGWLCELGANPEKAAMGFALAGDVERAEAYYQQYKLNPSALVFAFYLGKGVDGYQLAKKYVVNEGATWIPAAGGLAFRGEKDDLANFYESLILGDVDKTKLIQVICFNAAQSGNHKLADKYFKLYINDHKGNRNDIEPYMMQGIAMGSDSALQENFLNNVYAIAEEDKRKSDSLLYAVSAVKGFAMAGKHEEVEKICAKFKFVPEIDISEIAAQAYMQVGNKAKARKIGLNALLDCYLAERSDVRDTKTGKPKQYKGLPFPFFQKSFDDKEAAVKALKMVINREELPANFDLMQHLSTLRDGNLGKALRNFVKEGRADPFAGKPVQTVTEFITELNKHIQPDNAPGSSHGQGG